MEKALSQLEKVAIPESSPVRDRSTALTGLYSERRLTLVGRSEGYTSYDTSHQGIIGDE